MTDILKSFDDAIRRSVEEKRRQAREEPGKLILANMANQVINVWLLRRIAGKLGLNLTHLQAYTLVGIFGRDPGYPLNLIWLEKPVKPEVRTAAKKLADELVTAMAKARADQIKATVTTRSPGGRKLPGEFDDE